MRAKKGQFGERLWCSSLDRSVSHHRSWREKSGENYGHDNSQRFVTGLPAVESKVAIGTSRHIIGFESGRVPPARLHQLDS